MTNPFIGQITIFAGNFAPRSFAFCEGQLLAISQNTALFSILGTTYGGDGRTTFALPDLRGRVSVHEGRGPGLSNYKLGQRSGIEDVTLNLLQLPSHNHIASIGTMNATVTIPASSANGTTAVPTNGVIAQELDVNDENVSSFAAASATDTNLAPFPASVSGSLSLTNSGNTQSHENRRPFLAINYIIAMFGTYPSRS